MGFALAAHAGLLGAEKPYLLRDINKAPAVSPRILAALGDRLFFAFNEATRGVELWVADGTPDGTVLLKDINPGLEGSWPQYFALLGDRLFFRADDGAHGYELWATDGTPERTMLVKNINPGAANAWNYVQHPVLSEWQYTSDPVLAVLGDRLCFVADDGTHGSELWVTDGTPEGTSIVEDLRPGSSGSMYWIGQGVMCESTGLLFPQLIAHPNGTLFFAADDGVHGYELWALRVSCPEGGDTHCLGLEVQGPDGKGPGTYVATATAEDDSGDPISYTFSARRGEDAPIIIGPQAENTASFELGEGTWTVSVEVDDDPYCPDAAADAACTPVVVDVGPPPGGLQRPGDANQDGQLDLSDAVWLLGHLFLGTPGQELLPCEGGTASSPGAGDLALADVNRDGGIDISDPVSILGFLFLGRPPPALGTECVRIVGCPENVRCR